MIFWIARDKKGRLGLYSGEPVWARIDGERGWHGPFRCYIWDDKFPEVTCGNSPQRIELKLVENEQK